MAGYSGFVVMIKLPLLLTPLTYFPVGESFLFNKSL